MRRVLEHLAVIAGAAAAVGFTQFRRGTPLFLYTPGDVGVWIDAAMRIVQGEVLYRDFFDFLLPGVMYWNALLFRVFGMTPTALSIGVVLVGAALAWVLYLNARRTLHGAWAMLVPFAFVALVYITYSPGNHKWLGLLGGMTGTLFLTMRDGGRRWIVFSGIAHAVAVLCSQDLGAAFVIASVIVLLFDARRWSSLGLYAATVFAVGLAGMSWFFIVAGFDTVIDSVVVFPLTQYSTINTFGTNFEFYKAWSRAPRSVAHAVLLLGCLAALGRGLRWKSATEWEKLMGVTGAVLLLLSLPRRGLEVSMAAVYFVPLIPLFIASLRGQGQRLRWFVVAVLVLGGAYSLLGTIARRQWGSEYWCESHRAGKVCTARPLTGVTFIESMTARGDYAFAFPLEGGTYFLSQTRNPTRQMYLVDAEFSRREQVEEAARDIERHRPRAGVWNELGLMTLDTRTSTLGPFFARLTRSYEVVSATPGGFHLLRLRGDPAPQPPP